VNQEVNAIFRIAESFPKEGLKSGLDTKRKYSV
jgi:hypothetical protein